MREMGFLEFSQIFLISGSIVTSQSGRTFPWMTIGKSRWNFVIMKQMMSKLSWLAWGISQLTFNECQERYQLDVVSFESLVIVLG